MAASAAAMVQVSLLLGLTVPWALIGPCHSLTCASWKFSDNRVYATCSDLPQLGAHLHYTYNASSSSLSIAFTAFPASGGGWVSWAINPTGTGMVGSQALLALKLSDGSVVAKTYDISSYNSIVESKLSFDVWDLTAEDSNGSMTIFGSVKVPENAESLNQVWQIGGAVNGDRPSIHPLQRENRKSMSTLKLTASSGIISGTNTSPAPAPSKSVAIPVFQPCVLGLISGLALLIRNIVLSS